MELYNAMFKEFSKKKETQFIFWNAQADLNGVIIFECYRALNKIKAIIEDDSLNDKDCFIKIEKIINTLEYIGVCRKNRHKDA